MMLTVVVSIAAVITALALHEAYRHRGRADRADQLSSHLTETNRRLEQLISENERTRAALMASEEQVRQSQKMEAVGRLAGGVAHDFNNILTAISAYAEFLIESMPANDPRTDDAREIRRAARRAATLTSQLLAFSRRQIHQPRALDINVVVTELTKILGRVIGEDVELKLKLADTLGTVKADPTQMEQVLMNLVVNASEAMPEGGVITVSTENVQVGDTDSRPHPRLRAGSYVVLHVSDTGEGMDSNTMAHIFDPFFTTKEHGKGTGLGLATVYAIAERSGGIVAVHSSPGMGAEFSVYLPRVDEAAENFASGVGIPSSPRGTETVLLAEDDDAVRILAARILERHGYTVLAARDGREAMEAARRHAGEIDLLLTDVVMPHMGGRRLVDVIVAQRPNVRVIYMSGHTGGEIDKRGELDPGIAFIQKPFTAQSLLVKVRDVLDTSVAAVA